MGKVRWTYKKNQKAISRYLENVKELDLTDLTVRRSGRVPKARVMKLLAKSQQAFLTTSGGALWLSIENPDGSIVSMKFEKAEGMDTSHL